LAITTGIGRTATARGTGRSGAGPAIGSNSSNHRWNFNLEAAMTRMGKSVWVLLAIPLIGLFTSRVAGARRGGGHGGGGHSAVGVGGAASGGGVVAWGAGSAARPRRCMAGDSAAVACPVGDSVEHRRWAGSAAAPGVSAASDPVTGVSPDHRR